MERLIFQFPLRVNVAVNRELALNFLQIACACVHARQHPKLGMRTAARSRSRSTSTSKPRVSRMISRSSRDSGMRVAMNAKLYCAVSRGIARLYEERERNKEHKRVLRSNRTTGRRRRRNRPAGKSDRNSAAERERGEKNARSVSVMLVSTCRARQMHAVVGLCWRAVLATFFSSLLHQFHALVKRPSTHEPAEKKSSAPLPSNA